MGTLSYFRPQAHPLPDADPYHCTEPTDNWCPYACPFRLHTHKRPQRAHNLRSCHAHARPLMPTTCDYSWGATATAQRLLGPLWGALGSLALRRVNPPTAEISYVLLRRPT